jgi:hypothetical protein
MVSELTRKHRERQVKNAADDAVGLTVAERLTRRAKAQTVELPMMDEDGDFSIIMRQPTRAEMEELQRLQAGIQDESAQDDANERMCEVLGDLCIDDSLDTEFWQDGDYSMIDLFAVVQKLFEVLVEQVKAAQSFRAD